MRTFAWVAVLASTVAVAFCAACSPAPSLQADIGDFPARPVLVDSSSVAPCEFLTSSQQAELGIEGIFPGAGTVNGQPSPSCTWLSNGDVDYNTQYIGIDARLARSERNAELVQVNGFGAVRSVPAETFGGTPFCQVTIDAADRQTIRVQAKTTPYEPQVGIEEQCRRATDVGSMIMATLVATASR